MIESKSFARLSIQHFGLEIIFTATHQTDIVDIHGFRDDYLITPKCPLVHNKYHNNVRNAMKAYIRAPQRMNHLYFLHNPLLFPRCH